MTEHANAAPTPTSVKFGRTTPILRVANLEASIAFYVEKLGFHLHWSNRGFASVGREGATVMLCEGDQGHAGTWLYLGVNDVDTLADELRRKGAIIRLPPANYPWGAREMQLADPDGHVIRFGADARPGEPVGDWLDGEGVRWKPQDDGSWRAAE